MPRRGLTKDCLGIVPGQSGKNRLFVFGKTGRCEPLAEDGVPEEQRGLCLGRFVRPDVAGLLKPTLGKCPVTAAEDAFGNGGAAGAQRHGQSGGQMKGGGLHVEGPEEG